MNIQNVCILGAGNGGYMSAVDMSGYHGYSVSIFETVPGKLDEAKRAGQIELMDIHSNPVGVVGKVRVCDSIAEALAGADVILNPVAIRYCLHSSTARSPLAAGWGCLVSKMPWMCHLTL